MTTIISLAILVFLILKFDIIISKKIKKEYDKIEMLNSFIDRKDNKTARFTMN